MVRAAVLGLLLCASMVMSLWSFRINARHMAGRGLKSSQHPSVPAGPEILIEEPTAGSEASNAKSQDTDAFSEVHAVPAVRRQEVLASLSQGSAMVELMAGHEESNTKTRDAETIAEVHFPDSHGHGCGHGHGHAHGCGHGYVADGHGHGCGHHCEDIYPRFRDADTFAVREMVTGHAVPDMQDDAMWSLWQAAPMAGESNLESHDAANSGENTKAPRAPGQLPPTMSMSSESWSDSSAAPHWALTSRQNMARRLDADASPFTIEGNPVGGDEFQSPGSLIRNPKSWTLDLDFWDLDASLGEHNQKPPDPKAHGDLESQRQLEVNSVIEELRLCVTMLMKTEFVEKWIPGHVVTLSAEDWYKPWSIWNTIEDLWKELDELRHVCPYEFTGCAKDSQVQYWQERVEQCQALIVRIPLWARGLAIRVGIFKDVKKLQMNLKLSKLERFADLGWASTLGAVGDLGHWLEKNQESDWIHNAEAVPATEWRSLGTISEKIDDLAKKLEELSCRRRDKSVVDMKALTKGLQATLANIPLAAKCKAIKVGISHDIKLLQRKLETFDISRESKRKFGEWLEKQNQEKDYQGKPFHEIRHFSKLEKDPLAADMVANAGMLWGQVAKIMERLHARRQQLFSVSAMDPGTAVAAMDAGNAGIKYSVPALPSRFSLGP